MKSHVRAFSRSFLQTSGPYRSTLPLKAISLRRPPFYLLLPLSPLLERLLVFNPMTRLILVSYGETSDTQVIRAARGREYQNVCTVTRRDRGTSLHLPDGTLGEPDIVGDSEHGRPGDKVPSPHVVRLDQRIASGSGNRGQYREPIADERARYGSGEALTFQTWEGWHRSLP